MRRLFAAALLLTSASATSAQILVDDLEFENQVATIELDKNSPVLVGIGLSRMLTYEAHFEGTLFLSVMADAGVDPLLRVEDQNGRVIKQDDDSGGGKHAYLTRGVKDGETFVIRVAVKGSQPAQVQFKLFEAPETKQTRMAAAKALKELDEVERLRAAKSFPEARARLIAALDELLRVDGAPSSASVAEACYQFGPRAEELGAFRSAREARTVYRDHAERVAPDDHAGLQVAREGLACTLYDLGDVSGSRTLFEKVLEVRSRLLPGDHHDLQHARQNVARTRYSLGDLAGARALFERILEVRSRTMPDDDFELQRAREHVGTVMFSLGDAAGARALFEKVLEVRLRTFPEEHTVVQEVRLNLALTIKALGDLAGARTLEERVLEVFSRTLPDDHQELQAARVNLATTIKAQGDLAGARALLEKVLEVEALTLPDEHPHLQEVRQSLALTIAAQCARAERAPGDEKQKLAERAAGRERCAALINALCRAQVRAAREAILRSPGREAEERCSGLAKDLDTAVSFAIGCGVFEPMRVLESTSFDLAETTRGAAMVSAELTRRAADLPRYRELRDSLRQASDDLVGLVQKGTTSAEFDRARTKRESVERELVKLARELFGGKQSGVELDVESLAAKLAERQVAVSFRRFMKWRVAVVDELDASGQPAVRETCIDSLCAFVVRGREPGTTGDTSHTLTLVDLGPIEPIEAAARAWREAIDVGLERGATVVNSGIDRVKTNGGELRKLVFDPLLPALGTAQQLVVALDDVLHLVSLDALPLADSSELVGGRWRIATRATLMELLTDSPGPTGTALVALGGASFNVPPLALSAEDVASIGEQQPVQVAACLRGTAWERGFTPLTHTADEARGVVALYTEIYADTRPALVLEKRAASREALVELAPKARFVHIATHGWCARESIVSWSDPEPLDKQTGLGWRMTGEAQVKGMSPMLLCGLALAGANLPESANGRMPGLVTADELATLDLSNCELIVLSACDTNVGERRAGQGVASLQKALQMAGARSVITSLWKVTDEGTKELMLDFYRRLWVEKTPKAQALWEAKMKLRSAKDDRGTHRYSTRDWAGWVLTGDPN